MKNVLVLTAGYSGRATANGLCARALVKELKKQQIEVNVISCDARSDAAEAESYVCSIPYQPTKKAKKTQSFFGKMFSYAWKVCTHWWTPEYDKKIVQAIVEQADKICSRQHIDAVISLYFPLYMIVAGKIIKRKHPDTKFIIYELDSVADGIGGNLKWQRYLRFAYKRFLGFLYQYADCILILKCHKMHWLKEHSRHQHKMEIVDLPLLVEEKLPQPTDKRTQNIHFLYAGALDASYRSPKKMLETFSELHLDWNIDFFTKGCDDILIAFQNKNSNIHTHGYVHQETLHQAIANTDILLSIGNSVSNSLPSKVITYLAYRKPIIHFSLQKDDVCVDYLEKYPLGLVLNFADSIQTNCNKIISFVKGINNKLVSMDMLVQQFPMNTPEYSIRVIQRCIER